ncbi:endonuclease/exonuclease/phosphatase family metal-dependent hydrolase [Agrobacterium tumefaciens]|uniref:hypothetical protein n=1 Tax=Agrobacterium tumefaciens TaxID=358 RepID=UPI001AE39949|nr:hypothetical protein [Agrobacterium tumefaciens]MBP2508525.1 endonuclease/exonuclease/phosphatase family metal-dependent hydrolase [Agrobacterium tumefaciens]MBP2517677.1 endonuclease/exonuclease/phosphatase family metal-dependent hydrolase [Agrobacterium tumefaciens]MBP2576311.1 endonuclease/exonuclease/phosphatase family metal-dependent hydrolase [Agrobacterium tumefaciens]MBP2594667.1 endonuclease/exonuclease/phosphatase family metal-dependent hydrolase [Agrobacterium tumefaciens]
MAATHPIWKRTIVIVILLAVLDKACLAAEHRVSFLSWNIENYHHVPGYAFRGEIGTWRSSTDLKVIGRLVHGSFDTIFLQEASGQLAASILVGPDYEVLPTEEYVRANDAAPEATPRVYPFTAIRLASELRLVSSTSLSLPVADDPLHQTRDIQVISLSARGLRVGVIHVHLKSQCPRTLVSTTDECRLLFQQFELIDETVQRWKEQVDVLLVVGDFNREMLSPRLHDWTARQAPWITDLLPAPKCKLRPSPDVIDFIAIAQLPAGVTIDALDVDLAEIVRLKSERISDHCPLAFELRFSDVLAEGYE